MRATGEKSLLLSLQNVYETLAICVPTVIDALRGPVAKQASDARLEQWSRRLVENVGIELTVVGEEHWVRGETYLIMSNHQSTYDIPVLFRVFGSNLRMVTKRELFSVPIFGRALSVAGFIPIDRGNRRQASESLERAGDLLNAGTLVWIAPEGTRTDTGALLPFKKGGFLLAFQKGLRILPVTIQGTRDVMPSKASRSNYGKRVRVTIHKVLDPSDYPRDKQGRDRLMEDVRRAVESGL